MGSLVGLRLVEGLLRVGFELSWAHKPLMMMFAPNSTVVVLYTHSQRKMKMKQLESMIEVEGVEEDSELVMRFPKPFGVFDADENLISVRDVSFSWPTEAGEAPQPPLFEHVDFTVGAKARIAILGKNGCGECYCRAVSTT